MRSFILGFKKNKCSRGYESKVYANFKIESGAADYDAENKSELYKKKWIRA